jgi:hypothetical protein
MRTHVPVRVQARKGCGKDQEQTDSSAGLKIRKMLCDSSNGETQLRKF